jgi:hypothetical protein
MSALNVLRIVTGAPHWIKTRNRLKVTTWFIMLTLLVIYAIGEAISTLKLTGYDNSRRTIALINI